jgi:hypothetical protein
MASAKPKLTKKRKPELAKQKLKLAKLKTEAH